MYMEYTQRGMQVQPFGSQVVRVFVEDRGCIGFVDVDEHAGSTLEHIRKKIGEELDGVPDDFQFLLEMGGGECVPVQLKQERNRFVRQGKVLIRTMVPSRSVASQGSANNTTGSASSGQRANEMVVTVTYNDPEGRRPQQSMRVTPTETFAQLRREAADSWGLKPSNLVLRDENKCLWPDSATLLSVGKPDCLTVILEAKERLGAGEPSVDSARTMEAEGDGDDSDADCGIDYRKELWNIFTFYCTDGNPLMLERMTMKVFQRLARDCGIVRERDDGQAGREAGTVLRPHDVDIVFSAEVAATLNAEKRGSMVGQLKQHVGGGNAGKASLDWDGFFNALDAIGRRLRHAGAGNSESLNVIGLEAEPSALVHVLTNYVLPQRDEQYDPPGAKRWNVTTWADHLSQLRSTDIQRVFQHFASCLYEVFRFYGTTNHEAEDDNFVEYTHWRKFIADFKISALHLSSRDLAEIFLASAQSRGTHCKLDRCATGAVSRAVSRHPPGASPPTNSPETGSTCSEVPLEGRHLQMDKHAPFGQTRLFFPQFLDSIGLCALFVRPRLPAEQQRGVSALNLVKSLFQNVGRALNRSNMVRVVQMRESRLHGCLRDSGGFLRASVVFGHRLMSMWRKEGSVDYLTGESMIDCPPVSPSLARGFHSAVGRSGAAEIHARSRGSPLHRAATSRAALEGTSEYAHYSSPKDQRKRYGRHIMEQLLDTGINRSLAASVNSPSRTPVAVKISSDMRSMSDRSPAYGRGGTSATTHRSTRSSSESHLGHESARIQNSRKDLRFDAMLHAAPSGTTERRESTSSVRSEARSEAHASHSRGRRQRHIQRGGSSRSVSSMPDQAPRPLPVTVKSDSVAAQQPASPPRSAPEPPVQPETERTPMRVAPSPPLRPFVMVTQVHEGSPAAEAGLSSGDGIVEIGGVNVTNDGEAAEGGAAGIKVISRVVREAQNQQISVTVQRGTQMIALTIVPRQWSGAGLLGCGLNAVHSGLQSEHFCVRFEEGSLGLRFERLHDGRARVESVENQAQAKGVVAGDVIVAVGETPVDGDTNIPQLVQAAGRPFTMEFVRTVDPHQPSLEQHTLQTQREQQMQLKRQEESDRKKAEVLRRGAIFTKHSSGAFSSKKRRLLNWSQQHSCIQWRPPTSSLDDDSQVKSSIRITDITQVLTGARTSPSKKKKSKSEAADDNLALVIVTRNKQLRFDADTTQQRNEWVDALNWLLEHESGTSR